jgi:hypothetical protein
MLDASHTLLHTHTHTHTPILSTSPALDTMGKSMCQALPAKLPRVDRHHDIGATHCACGQAFQRIGEEVSEQLDCVPAQFSVRECPSMRTLSSAPRQGLTSRVHQLLRYHLSIGSFAPGQRLKLRALVAATYLEIAHLRCLLEGLAAEAVAQLATAEQIDDMAAIHPRIAEAQAARRLPRQRAGQPRCPFDRLPTGAHAGAGAAGRQPVVDGGAGDHHDGQRPDRLLAEPPAAQALHRRLAPA